VKPSLLPCLILCGAFAVPASTAFANAPTAVDDPKPVPEKRDDEKKVKVLEIGSTVPERITLKDFEGKATSFKDLRDKVVIVHFWSYRCPAEKHANPIFKQMEARYAKSDDVVMLGIVSNQNELGPKPGPDADYSKHYKELREKYEDVGYSHTMLADHGNEISDLFGARSTPHCFVIDKKGVLRYSGALDDDPRGQKGDEATNYVVEVAEAVAAGKKVPYEETKPYG
jgi:thiol-disulfide isomerase/thioredoxin